MPDGWLHGPPILDQTEGSTIYEMGSGSSGVVSAIPIPSSSFSGVGWYAYGFTFTATKLLFHARHAALWQYLAESNCCQQTPPAPFSRSSFTVCHVIPLFIGALVMFDNSRQILLTMLASRALRDLQCLT